MDKFVLLFSILLSIIYGEKQYCYFEPPANWDMQVFKETEPVEVGFLGKANSISRPNIYLSEEEVDCKLSQYITSVKNLYKNNPNFTFKNIGSITTKSGIAHLAEIESKTKIGVIKMLQCILIKDNRAYVITGANAKQNFTDTHLEYLKVFKSIHIVKNPIDLISDAKQREDLKNTCSEKTPKKDMVAFLDKQKSIDPYLKKLTIDFHQKNLSTK